jgi:pantothenate kinase type III
MEEKSTATGRAKTTIDYAEWPRDAPTALERNVITIVCGNTRLHWALHEGCMNKFIPIMFWYTVHDANGTTTTTTTTTAENQHESKNGSSTSTEQHDEELELDPCDVLEAHVASQAHTLIFGDGDKKGCIEGVSRTAAKRDAPGISVFVVSSNPSMEQKILHMFRDVPAKLFKLRNTDFFSQNHGVYPTMGVDRVAALYGARLHYGAPALVIDGGTALTYTCLDENSKIVGGGISPGVKVRLQSLADYTGSLPIIGHKQFKSTVEAAIEAKKPLPFFAKNTEMAMISPVCGELACQLRNIIKQYIARCQASASTAGATEGETTAEKASAKLHKRFPVIITGGDGKFLKDLLQADASKIVSVEPDASPVPAHSVELRHVKNLVTYALGDILYEKYSQKSHSDPEEVMKLKIQGLRIASPAIDQKELFSRGCVFHITPESVIEGYVFHARFDNGTQKDLTLRELYDCLVLYNEIGEKPEPPKGVALRVDEDWVIEKKMWSKKVQEELGNVSRLIRNRIRQLKPHAEKGELAEVFQRLSSIESRMSKNSSATAGRVSKKAKRSPAVSPKHYIGKRIAKRFPIDIGGSTGDQIFYGTVKFISDNLSQWYYVQYDDGDSEDLVVDGIIEGIDLYEVHKFNDPMHRTDLENPDFAKPPKSSLPQGSKPRTVLLHNTITDENAEDGTPTTTYTDLPTLLGLSAASDGCNSSSGTGANNMRLIAEFKEEI